VFRSADQHGTGVYVDACPIEALAMIAAHVKRADRSVNERIKATCLLGIIKVTVSLLVIRLAVRPRLFF
jgi:hypothetical protein